jgi:DNA-binding NarL/FixJ family response regulator
LFPALFAFFAVNFCCFQSSKIATNHRIFVIHPALLQTSAMKPFPPTHDTPPPPAGQKGDGMNYAPKGKPRPAVKPGEFAFAAAHLDHGHIYGQCNGLTEAGAELRWVYDPDPKKVEAFREKFPQAKAARSLDEILAQADLRLVAAAATVDELLGRWITPMSVVLLDLHLGDGSDIGDNVMRLQQQGAGVLIVTSDHRPAAVGRALDAGALGLVLKEDSEESLVEAIWNASKGQFAVSSRLAQQLVTEPTRRVRLSRKELDVLGLLARGLPWSAIAKEVETTPDTARTYCYRVVEKYARVGTDVSYGPREVAYMVTRDGHLDLDVAADTEAAADPESETDTEPGD